MNTCYSRCMNSYQVVSPNGNVKILDMNEASAQMWSNAEGWTVTFYGPSRFVIVED